MKIDFTPEQARIVQFWMEQQATHNARQAAEFHTAAVSASGVAEKLAAGVSDFDEAEIRRLMAFVDGLDIFRRMAPQVFTAEGVALLQGLEPQLTAAKAKLNN